MKKKDLGMCAVKCSLFDIQTGLGSRVFCYMNMVFKWTEVTI